MSAAVWGVGTSPFGTQPDRPLNQLAWGAVAEVFADAGTSDVDAVFVGTVMGPPGLAQRTLATMGLDGVPVFKIENACASGTTAFHEAVQAVESGRFRQVLALGLEQLSTRFGGAIHPERTDPEGRMGLSQPGHYALIAQRYQNEYGLTERQLASVSVKSSRFAAHNSRAQHTGQLSLEAVLSSRMIADPLTLLQCCSISDGAAAAIVGSGPRTARDVPVLASTHHAGRLWDHRTNLVPAFATIQAASSEALHAAGLAISDIDVFELHDAFTIGEIVGSQALGVAPPGQGGALAESGETGPEGSRPLNPSGGLLARGHPLGATGLAQISEVVWQLRGDAGGRQVPDACHGLVETMGGGVSGIDANCCVIVVLGSA